MSKVLQIMSATLVGFAALTLVVTGAAAYTFVVSGTPETPSAPKPLNCGQIQGRIGGLPTWQVDSSSSSPCCYQISWGDYGGEWDGSQYEMVEPRSEVHTDTLKHEYTQTSNSSPSHKFAYVKMDAVPELSGSSAMMSSQSPEWWWSCSCVAQAQRPIVKYRVGGDWIEPQMDVDNDPNNDVGNVSGGVFGAQDVVDSEPATPQVNYPVPVGVPHYPPNTWRDTGNPTTNTVPTNYPESQTGYVGDLPNQPPGIHNEPTGRGNFRACSKSAIPPSAELVEFSLRLDVNATVGSDNATVSDWKVVLKVDFESRMCAQKVTVN